MTIWRTFKSGGATDISSGQGTNDPVFGTTATSSATARFLGYFDPLTLDRVGDSISLTYSVSFNDAAGMGNSGDNFRFALFDRNGEAIPAAQNIGSAGSSDTNAFLGYWAGVMTGAGTDGSLRERFDVSQNDMLANGSASDNLASPPIGGTNVVFQSAVGGVGAPPVYTGQMTITRTTAGVQLSGAFSGNGGANTFSAIDPSPVTLTYSVVGFLNGSGLSADQVRFDDVDVTFTPAPETLTLEVLAAGPHAGAMRLVNRTDAAIDFSYYEINSESGSLDPAGWRSLDDQSSTNPPHGWGEAPGVNSEKLSEALILGQQHLAPGQAVALGHGYNGPLDDLELSIGDGVNPLRFGEVQFVMPGDFNGDGAVGGDDLAQWAAGVSATSDLGDADFDGDSDGADFLDWQRNLGQTAPSAAAAITVPEPGTCVLVVLAAVVVLCRRPS